MRDRAKRLIAIKRPCAFYSVDACSDILMQSNVSALYANDSASMSFSDWLYSHGIAIPETNASGHPSHSTVVVDSHPSL